MAKKRTRKRVAAPKGAESNVSAHTARGEYGEEVRASTCTVAPG